MRGVNSTFILRNLSIRGLVERVEDEKDKRVFKYKATLSLLAHLGLTKIEELPNFAEFKQKIEESKSDRETKNDE
jgi:chromosome segregation and condensation protein ScpB